MTPPLSRSFPGLALRAGGATPISRSLPEEVPVAIVCNGTTQAVMMATPGDIRDFAHGFALTEGLVARLDEIEAFEKVASEEGIEARLWLRSDRADALAARRRRMAGPVGCGLCGIESLEEANRPAPRVPEPGFAFSRIELAGATDALRAHQALHALTGATHAAGFLVPGEGVIAAREDVGRHNALDKLIGALALRGADMGAGAFVLTSRISVELVQKCAMAGCPVLVAVSAPTAHALRVAEAAGITLVAFARQGGFDVFSHPERIKTEAADVA